MRSPATWISKRSPACGASPGCRQDVALMTPRNRPGFPPFSLPLPVGRPNNATDRRRRAGPDQRRPQRTGETPAPRRPATALSPRAAWSRRCGRGHGTLLFDILMFLTIRKNEARDFGEPFRKRKGQSEKELRTTGPLGNPCEFVRFRAVSCGFVRIRAVSCGFVRIRVHSCEPVRTRANSCGLVRTRADSCEARRLRAVFVPPRAGGRAARRCQDAPDTLPGSQRNRLHVVMFRRRRYTPRP